MAMPLSEELWRPTSCSCRGRSGLGGGLEVLSTASPGTCAAASPRPSCDMLAKDENCSGHVASRPLVLMSEWLASDEELDRLRSSPVARELSCGGPRGSWSSVTHAGTALSDWMLGQKPSVPRTSPLGHYPGPSPVPYEVSLQVPPKTACTGLSPCSLPSASRSCEHPGSPSLCTPALHPVLLTTSSPRALPL